MYLISEKFKSLQGEGAYAGTPMAFIRFVGCSVGKKVCHACDTDFEVAHNWRGGGSFEADELMAWVNEYDHVCLTGGEPLDQDLLGIFEASHVGRTFHIETSGTKPVDHLFQQGVHRSRVWLCVSPKPGYDEEVVLEADEVKVIVPGLGSGPGWPTLDDALRWAARKKLVFLQPRNGRFDIDHVNLRYVQDLLIQHPTLRLSVQMHKILHVQ
jgi:organic radical activating enzyme